MNISKKILLSTLVVAGSVASCTSGFDEINEPQNSFTKEQLRGDNYEIAASFPQLQQLIVPAASSGYFQHFSVAGDTWGRFLMSNTKWNNNLSVFRYMHEGWINTPFDILTNFYPEFRKIKEGTQGRGISYAWALINRVGLMHRLTDLYGPIPYTQIEGGNLHVPYDSQEAVYKAMLADLNTAIAEITSYLTVNPTAILMKDQDLVYQGDFRKWVRFANSLKLRMAVRMRYAAPALAKQYAEEAVADGVIESAADNLYMSYTPRGLYKTSVEWGDSRAAADIDSYMNGYNDPRISKYFAAPAEGAKRTLQGCLAAAEITSKNKADAIYSAAVASPNSRDPWLTAAEMWFCRAEGALAGWTGMGATVQEAYERGVKESFAQWGVDGAASYLQSERQPAAYTDAVGGFGRDMSAVSTITPKWDSSASTEEQLERIITQKWIALYPNGQEAWSEIRRTGYPKVFDLPVDTGTGLQVPNRIPYDPNEQTRNAAAYRAGVALLGGPDDYTTRLWWQKK